MNRQRRHLVLHFDLYNHNQECSRCCVCIAARRGGTDAPVPLNASVCVGAACQPHGERWRQVLPAPGAADIVMSN